MYYYLAWLCRPYTLLLLLMAVSLIGLWRRHRDARRRLPWLIVPFAALTGLSTPAVAFLALGTLEWAFPPTSAVPDVDDTIVVLAGSVHPASTPQQRAELGESTIQRCQYAAALYHHGGSCKIVVSGGKVRAETPGPPCAEAMGDYLAQLGVRRSHLVVEDQSRSTHESAVACREILDSQSHGRVFLVTEATHMARSRACFRAQGMEVIPAGCHYRAAEFRFKLSKFLPSSSALKNVETAAHEWIGLAWYWLYGRI